MKYKMKPLIAFFTLLLPPLLAFAEAKKSAQPNLIFILADDLGWKDVGFMGCEFFETPNIDRLAKQGMKFTSAYSGGPNCAPTRACLMSGTYTPRHKIYTPGGSSKGNHKYMRLLVPARERKNKELTKKAAEQFPINNSLDPAYVCIPEVLGQAGYRTARIGKWHLGEDVQGFHLSTSNGKGGPGGKFYDNGGLPKLSQLDPLRGQKGSLFEAGVRVATCMRWTKRIEPGTICATPITSVDFLPTFASLAGGKLPKKQPIDGADVSPLLLGKEIAERSIFWHYPLYLQGRGLDVALPNGKTYSWRGFPSTSLVRGQWKLIEFHEDDSVVLYNLEDDPGERKNLAKKMPERAAKLRAELDAWQKKTKAPVPKLPNPECVLK